MDYIQRAIESPLRQTLERGKSVLLLGPRQTGKTTLLKHLGYGDITITLLDPERRLRLEKSPNLLRQEIAAYRQIHTGNRAPLVIIDEVQKVPALMDVVQLLVDNHEAQFILTGSSVRKLRRHSQFNLLPGRVINFHLDPLSLLELPTPLPPVYGSLPAIALEKTATNRQIELQAYVTNYLEEEVRGEALVRQLGSFARFIELAAVEAGAQININKLSQELGISRHTMAEYFYILENCLIAEKIEPVTQTTTRRKLTKAPKYLYFDMGIRRIAANEGTQLSSITMGNLFEQFIGLELLRMLRIRRPSARLRYWRDHAGPEVDYVIEHEKTFIPIEVKWTESPTPSDAKHLKKFMAEYPTASNGYIICQCDKPLLLQENILALPWQQLPSLLQ
jgi:predicted AAA+ superfamily ATPase